MSKEAFRVRMSDRQMEFVIHWARTWLDEHEVADPDFANIEDLHFRVVKAINKTAAENYMFHKAREMQERIRELEQHVVGQDPRYAEPPAVEMQMPRMPTEPLSQEEIDRKERMAKLMEDTRKRYEEIHSAAAKDSHENNDSDD